MFEDVRVLLFEKTSGFLRFEIDVHGTCSAGASALVSLRSRLETLVERLEASPRELSSVVAVEVLPLDWGFEKRVFSGVFLKWLRGNKQRGFQKIMFFNWKYSESLSTRDFGVQWLP